MKTELRKFLFTSPLVALSLIIPSSIGSDQFLSVVLLILVAAFMLLIDFSLEYLVLYIFIFLTGPLAESIAIHYGVWSYRDPVFIGVPLWLFIVWGNTGLYIVRVTKLIHSIFRHLKSKK